jgi:aspartyl-tRNA(Asn)/glutamyl-tRNA(Gln) amidotransferase subunit C
MSEFKDKLKKTAKLAAIKISSEEEELYTKEIGSILNLLESFQEVNTEGIEPLRSVNESNLSMRKDVVEDPNSADKVMKSTSHTKYGYFVTPKFVD